MIDLLIIWTDVLVFFLLQGALDYADERSGSNSTTGSVSGSCNNHSSENSSQGALIFLHAGTYRGEFLVIDSDIALIGEYLKSINSFAWILELMELCGTASILTSDETIRMV